MLEPRGEDIRVDGRGRRPTARRAATGAPAAEWLISSYKMSENYLATFVEVAVQLSTGRINVKRVVCAHDCGLVVNPDALRNQIEGGIVQGLSRALHEEVQFDESRVTSVDWAHVSDPAIFGSARDRRGADRTPRGGAVGRRGGVDRTVAAALGNAIFDATGVRLRRVPFTAERVKAALAAVG